VRAKTPVRALRIASEIFLGLITENPGCALDVMRQLSARIDASNARLAATQRELETLRSQLTSAGSRRDAMLRRSRAAMHAQQEAAPERPDARADEHCSVRRIALRAPVEAPRRFAPLA
jgi:CRP-like cAMP-binding protein